MSTTEKDIALRAKAIALTHALRKLHKALIDVESSILARSAAHSSTFS